MSETPTPTEPVTPAPEAEQPVVAGDSDKSGAPGTLTAQESAAVGSGGDADTAAETAPDTSPPLPATPPAVPPEEQTESAQQSDADAEAAQAGEVAPIDGGVVTMSPEERDAAGLGPVYGEAVRPADGTGTITIPEGFEHAAQSARGERVEQLVATLDGHSADEIAAAVEHREARQTAAAEAAAEA